MRCTRPRPAQLRQGSRTVSPVPWQAAQVRSTVKKPWLALTRPAPLQVEQAVGGAPPAEPVPEQESQAAVPGASMAACLPRKASSSVMRIL